MYMNANRMDHGVLHADASQSQLVPPSPFCVPHSLTSYGVYGTSDAPKLNHQTLSSTMTANHLNMQALAAQYGGMHNAMNQPPKKRKYSDSPPGTLTPDIMNSIGMTSNIPPIKPEPCPPDLHYGLGPADCSEDDSYSYDFATDAGMFLDGTYQVIKWTAHQPTKWATLVDETGKDLPAPVYRVDADKGFNHAPPDDAFVCQKKNHFQITVHVGISAAITASGLATMPKFIRLPDDGGVVPIDALYLHFYGIKMESPSQMISIEQSQSDRSKKPFHPVRMDLTPDQVTKLTVGRLHFSETTSNNMRKKGKPNPDQRYFQLVVALMAHCGPDKHILVAHVSERIIVRASNPGQFENDMEALWNKGKTSESVYHTGRVGVNTDSPDEALTVHGNVKLTGHVISPSDVRAKKDIREIDTRNQLRNISQLKVYQYSYNDDFAEYAGLLDGERADTGVLAQEVRTVLPDAVRETGDVLLPNGEVIDNFLVVNKERIFIENVGAVKELCKVTDKLENRITEIEVINKRLTKINSLGRSTNLRSTCSHSSISISTTSSVSQRDNKSNSSSASSPADAKRVTKTSQVKSRNHHASHQCQHHSRPNSSACSLAQQPVLCSNRAIHISVIVLVAVMALCLLSITILYVVDRKIGSSQTSSSVQLHHSANSSTTTQRPIDPWEPLLPEHCVSNPNDCPYTCCAVPSPSPQNDPVEPGASTVPFASSTLKLFDKSTRSPNDVRQHLDDIDRLPVDQKSSVSLSSHHLSTLETNYVIDVIPALSDVDTKQNDAINKVDAMDDPSNDKGTWVGDVFFVLLLKQLNLTISSTYCIDSMCRSETGGNYTYSIPLSPHFPNYPVTARFVAKKGGNELFIAMCSNETKAVCPQSDSDMPARKINSLEWDMPLAFYHNSKFKFRIGRSQNVCSYPRQDVGSTFVEYNLYFYRVCTSS
jgi:hypothetical protein